MVSQQRQIAMALAQAAYTDLQHIELVIQQLTGAIRPFPDPREWRPAPAQHDDGSIPSRSIPVDAAGRDVQQQIDQMVGKQVDLIDIQHATVGLGQHAWREARAAFAQRGVEIQRADQTLFGSAQRQGDELTAGQHIGQPAGQRRLGHASWPSINTPPMRGSMAVRHNASFRSSAPTTAASGKCGVSLIVESDTVISSLLCPGAGLPAPADTRQAPARGRAAGLRACARSCRAAHRGCAGR